MPIVGYTGNEVIGQSSANPEADLKQKQFASWRQSREASEEREGFK
jgi:hypothetical protein